MKHKYCTGIQNDSPVNLENDTLTRRKRENTTSRMGSVTEQSNLAVRFLEGRL